MNVEILDNEIIVKIPMNENLKKTQNLLDYIRYLEISSKSKANEVEIEKLLSEIKQDTWQKFKNERNLDE